MKKRMIKVALLLFGLLAVGITKAAPTFEQVQSYMKQAGIPQWRNAASAVNKVRMSPPDPSAAELWNSLDTETDSMSGKAPLGRTTNPRDTKEMFQYATWLRWRILTQNADGRYSFTYAFDLSRMQDKNGGFLKEAAIFFFHAKLALVIDGLRCVDRSGADNIIFGYESQKTMQPLMDQIGRMTKKEKASAMLEAISIEQMRGERPAFGWLCNYGGRAVTKALNSDAQIKEGKSQGSEAINQNGKTLYVDVAGVVPEFVSDEQWRKERATKFERLARSAAEDL